MVLACCRAVRAPHGGLSACEGGQTGNIGNNLSGDPVRKATIDRSAKLSVNRIAAWSLSDHGTTLFGYFGRFGVTGGFFFRSASNTSIALSSCGS